MSESLKGKVAVVTGAASGIGLATTKLLIEADVKVFMVDWDEKTVQEKAGLNQWNAAGRQRDPDEVYIPVPAKFHHRCPSFFPRKDTKFELILPGKKTISAKICQDGSKALMSDPNKELGKWILRDVLRLQDGELLTIDRLYQLGIDSVRIDKLKDGVYEMNFAAVDSYEDFINE